MAAAPFGVVKSGSIELAGVLYDAFINEHDALCAFDLTLDGCIQSSTHLYLDDTLKNVTACEKTRRIACLALRVEECAYYAICRAIVLEPVAREQGTWLRVGAVTVSWKTKEMAKGKRFVTKIFHENFSNRKIEKIKLI